MLITKNIPVLMYHRICRDDEWSDSEFIVSESVFQKQLEYLAGHRYYTPSLSDILLRNITDSGKSKRPVVLTFDDGYLDNFETALPMLRRFGFTAIIFLVADFSKRVNWWDADLPVMQAPLLQRHHIRHLVEAGIDFGSHTISHPSLPRLDDRSLQEELTRSKEAVEEMVQQPISSLAYPYGYVNERVRNAARHAGYECAFATNSGPFQFYTDLFQIRRINMTNHAGRSYMFSKLSGLERGIRWLKSRSEVLAGRPSLGT